MIALAARTCAGCGTELPPQTWTGRSRKWCTDRCRKRTLYGRRCIDCGGYCDGSSGNLRQATRCQECATRHATAERKWTDETVGVALLKWAREKGRAPTVEDAQRDPDLPGQSTTAITEMGGWAETLIKFGLWDRANKLGRGGGPNSVTKDDALDAIWAYREHGTLAGAAEALGVSGTTVSNRMNILPEGRKLLMTTTTRSNGHTTESRAVIVLRRELERSEKLVEQKRAEIQQIEAESEALRAALGQLTGAQT